MLQRRPGSILGVILGFKWETKGAKMPPKIVLKIDEISRAFFNGIPIAKLSKNDFKCLPRRRQNDKVIMQTIIDFLMDSEVVFLERFASKAKKRMVFD